MTYYAYPSTHWRQLRTTDEIHKPFFFLLAWLLRGDLGRLGSAALPTINEAGVRLFSAFEHCSFLLENFPQAVFRGWSVSD